MNCVLGIGLLARSYTWGDPSQEIGIVTSVVP